MSRDFPIEVPWQAATVPHATIEVNQMCNIACHGCYKSKMTYTKPVELVKEEVDFAARERRLESITLLGGEPTLHPELAEIICYIASKGIHPVILTNASRLTKELLNDYKRAGVFAIRMHIDSHQHNRPDTADVQSEEELNSLRWLYIARCREAGIEPYLALTVYKNTLEEMPAFMQFCHQAGVRDVLCTLYLQSINGHHDEDCDDDGLTIKNREVYDFLFEREGIRPMWYVPSSNNPQALRWMTYFANVTVNPKGTCSRLFLQPKHRRALDVHRGVSRLHRARYRFSVLPTPVATLALFIPYALLSFSASAIKECFAFLRAVLRNGNMHCFRIAFQELPVLNENGEFDMCKNCPDATVRNGRLIPVCLADHLDPVAAHATSN
ncbi:MAG: radical SAM protein [Candidatus Hydrogenedentes bacterium]|nr:radical SAM protein [Candidatus Hydrogenedentota bacterium]